jgi:hypothetical protein
MCPDAFEAGKPSVESPLQYRLSEEMLAQGEGNVETLSGRRLFGESLIGVGSSRRGGSLTGGVLGAGGSLRGPFLGVGSRIGRFFIV